MGNPLAALHELGQSVWLDSIRRSYTEPGGYLDTLIDAGDIDGLTSNPTIFAQAIATEDNYADQLDELRGADARDALWALMTRDVLAACDRFLDLHRASGGTKGFVSIEVDPAKAFDTEETVADGLALFGQIDRPNLMVKVPGTEPGLAAVTRLIGAGVNVNVTLLFSVARYEAVAQAYIDGLAQLAESGGDVSAVSSVASFFVSRVDAKVDAQLEGPSPLRSTAAIANARVAYGAFQRIVDTPAFIDLEAQGARVQRPLWASTSTKDPDLSDVLYVDELAGPNTVNTVPEVTLDAFRDHGTVEDRLSGTAAAAADQLQHLAEEGVDLDQITKELETEGVEKFIASFEEAVETVGRAVAD